MIKKIVIAVHLCIFWVMVTNGQAEEYTVVSNGHAVNVRNEGYWIEKYYNRPGMKDDELQFVEITGCDNYLYADKPIGKGDFHIKVRLAVYNIQNNQPAFTCNSFFPTRTIDAFFFNYSGNLLLEGRMFGIGGKYSAASYLPSEFDQQIEKIKSLYASDRKQRQRIIGERNNYFEEGKPFVFELVRKGDNLTFYINEKIVTRAKCPVSVFGEVGFRSMGCDIRLYDFRIDGHVLDMDDYLMNVSDAQSKKLQDGKKNGLLDVSAVHLPVGDKVVGYNWHFMAPIATMVDDTIIMSCSRDQSHDWAKGERQKDGKAANYDLISTSEDGGKSWSKLTRLADYKKSAGSNTVGSMSAIGTVNGVAIQINQEGCYRSFDKGKNWEYLSGAFTRDQLKNGPAVTLGPRIIETAYGLTTFQSNGRQNDELWLRFSNDNGLTWQQTFQNLPDSTRIHGEPSAVMYENNLIVLGRVWSAESFDPKERTYRYGQYWSTDGKLPVKSALTNIKTTDAFAEMIPIAGRIKSVGFGPWSQDTPDIIYNPVSKRIEAVVTNRMGGGLGRESDRSVCTLNLWSIDPEQLLSGSSVWRFEGTLLERKITDTPKFHDGMHPAGGVVDIKRGLHHIFVWIGYYDGPTGIYRISIPLDTQKVSKFLQQ